MSDAEDNELERRLAEVIDALVPRPDDTAELAAAAFALRDLDAELAELTFDSAVAGLGDVRGAGDVRQLSFELGEWMLDIELGSAGRDVRVTGMLNPPGRAEVAVERADRTTIDRAATDERGRFSFASLARGLVRLRAELATGQALVTDWVRI